MWQWRAGGDRAPSRLCAGKRGAHPAARRGAVQAAAVVGPGAAVVGEPLCWPEPPSL